MANVSNRRDPTESIARALRRFLEPEEGVLAAVAVQTPGTNAAAIEGAGSGAVAAAMDTGMSTSSAGAGKHAVWLEQAQRVGIDAKGASGATWLHLALTEGRVLLARRSRLTGRPRVLLAAWPVGDVDSLEVPRNGSSLTITVDGEPLRLELPRAHKFLPNVYRELPKRWERARAEAGA